MRIFTIVSLVICWLSPTVGDLNAYVVYNQYDRDGNLVGSPQSGLHIEYDLMNRPAAVDLSDKEKIRLSWCQADQLIRYEADTIVQTQQFDEFGRLRQVKINDSAANYEYDKEHRITQITYPSGLVVSYRYDCDGRTLAVNSSEGDGVAYEWDRGADRIVRVRLNNGWVSHYRYDSVGRITEVRHCDKAGKQQFSFRYVYDAYGKCVTKCSCMAQCELETTYTYDSIGQLIEATYSAAIPAEHFLEVD